MSNAGTKRLAISAVIALPVMVALLFLMTRLILPSEQDPIIARMIQNIEFQRTIVPIEPETIEVFKLPPKPKLSPLEPELPVKPANPNQTDELPVLSDATEDQPTHAIDWWAEARKQSEDADEEAFERWLLEQGYKKYVSIMQGALPITKSARGTLDGDPDGSTGYMNSFGDMEFKISENCVMRTQVSARLDQSDFSRALPMIVTCKSPSKQKYIIERK